MTTPVYSQGSIAGRQWKRMSAEEWCDIPLPHALLIAEAMRRRRQVELYLWLWRVCWIATDIRT